MAIGASPEDLTLATAYQTLLVPALFTTWASRIADTLPLASGQRVLDVACGTGVLTLQLLRRVGDSGMVCGLDQDPGMLSVAAGIEPGVRWQLGSAESLPYPDHSLDAVTCHFGLMFFADRIKAIREMFRVLKPAGHIAIAAWASLEQIPVYACLVSLIERIAGQAAADIMRQPFCLGDHDTLTGLFHEAGYPNVHLSVQNGKARFPSVQTMMDIELRTKSWLPLGELVSTRMTEDQKQQIRDAAEQVLEQYCNASGELAFDTSAFIVTGNNT